MICRLIMTFGYVVSVLKIQLALGFCYNMTLKPESQDVKSINNKLVILQVSSAGGCARGCTYEKECLAFFVNKITWECTLHSRPIANLTLRGESGWVGYDFLDPLRTSASEEPEVRLWIESVYDVSSEYAEVFAAVNVIGPPNVYPLHGDYTNAWAPMSYDQGPEWIEVAISQLLFLTRIDVYETFNPGGTKEIAAMKPNGNWDVIWTTPQLTHDNTNTSKINTIEVKPSYATDQLKITTDGAVAQSWVEIDAVEVFGWPA